MRIENVKKGQWFTKEERLYVRVTPFICGQATVSAINLRTGEFAFLTPTGETDIQALRDVDIQLVEKPDILDAFKN